MRGIGGGLAKVLPEHKKTITLMCVVAGLAGAGAVAMATLSPRDSTIVMSPSWAKGYSDISGLKADADIAVDGTISRIISVNKDSNGLVFTDYALTIQGVAWDPHGQVSAAREVTIHQSGGVIGDSRYEMSDDPLFQVGDHVVLFLHEYNPGYYFVLGGPAGRFVVRNGSVQPINKDAVQLSRPMSESEFLANIRQS